MVMSIEADYDIAGGLSIFKLRTGRRTGTQKVSGRCFALNEINDLARSRQSPLLSTNTNPRC